MAAADQKLRVLVLGDHFGYAGGVMHGGTSYYLNVLPRLRKLGVEVQCCFLREPHPSAAQLEANGIRMHFLAAGKWDFLLAGRIEKIARDMQANVLHVANMKSTVFGLIVARRLGISMFVHSHDMNIPPLPARFAYSLLRTRRERGLAVSTAAADLMPYAYGIDRGSVAVLPNAIDVAALQSTPLGPLPQGIPESGPRIAWAGRLHEVKGPLRMIRAMAAVTAAIPGAHLVMAGEGSQRPDCERLIAQLGLEGSVTLLGQRGDLSQIFRHVELLCVTSYNEGFSLVAAEAAAAGIPVVAYKVGGLTEVVEDGRTGVLVPDGDEERLVATLCDLLRDDARRRALGDQAAVRVRRYALEGHLERLLAEYEGALTQVARSAA